MQVVSDNVHTYSSHLRVQFLNPRQSGFSSLRLVWRVAVMPSRSVKVTSAFTVAAKKTPRRPCLVGSVGPGDSLAVRGAAYLRARWGIGVATRSRREIVWC
jgi:hypothetical protein